MAEQLSGGGGMLQAVVTITRKATGETEEYLLTGYIKAEDAQKSEDSDGRE